MINALPVPLDHGGAAELIQATYANMLATRGEKYKGWIANIERYKRYARIGAFVAPFGLRYFKGAPARVNMLEAIYIALRLVDDIVDGDAELPAGWDSTVAYIDNLIAFVRRPQRGKNQGERLLAYAFGIGVSLQMNLRRCVIDILGSLRFDAVRRKTKKLYLPTAAELQRHFYRLDIRGTIGGCLIVTRETRVTYRDLYALGTATRIFYDLRDLEEDIRAGLCNIPREDIRKFGIRDVRDLSLPTITDWRLAKAEEGLGLLREYQASKHRLRLHRFTRTALYRGYERPAEEFLHGLLYPE